jgi:hypothetical protein
MTDFGFLDDYKAKYNFNYTKSSWITDYGDLLRSKLKLVVRRKSCYCTGCGRNGDAIDRILCREILFEPIYPYIKSQEEVEYENRV